MGDETRLIFLLFIVTPPHQFYSFGTVINEYEISIKLTPDWSSTIGDALNDRKFVSNNIADFSYFCELVNYSLHFKL